MATFYFNIKYKMQSNLRSLLTLALILIVTHKIFMAPWITSISYILKVT